VVGVATGFAMVELFSPEDGLHKYVPPPLALSVVLELWQTVTSPPAAAIGGVQLQAFESVVAGLICKGEE